jgi:hypothetical protein
MSISEEQWKVLNDLADDIKDNNPLFKVVANILKMVINQDELNITVEERLDAIVAQMIILNERLELLEGKRTVH